MGVQILHITHHTIHITPYSSHTPIRITHRSGKLIGMRDEPLHRTCLCVSAHDQRCRRFCGCLYRRTRRSTSRFSSSSCLSSYASLPSSSHAPFPHAPLLSSPHESLPSSVAAIGTTATCIADLMVSGQGNKTVVMLAYSPVIVVPSGQAIPAAKVGASRSSRDHLLKERLGLEEIAANQRL